MSIYSYKDTKPQKPKDDVPRRKGWATPYGFVDCKEPVTYQEACDMMKVISDAWKKTPNKDEPSPAAQKQE